MTEGHFYCIDDQYFIDFPDSKLMKNKEKLDGNSHDRPCFCAFLDANTNLYWMIPFSSKVSKFRAIYNRKVSINGFCDTIIFGEVLGHEKAFLIQNMCPITSKYIKNKYLDAKGNPVQVPGDFEKKLIKQAKTVLYKQRKGFNLIFPDVLSIEKKLLDQINT